MATFTFSGYCRIEYDGTQFVISRAFNPYPVSITNNTSSSVIRVTQSVDIDGPISDSTEVVEAITTYGIVTYNSVTEQYSLYTNDDSLEERSILDVTPTQYPVCFVKGTLIDTIDGPVPIELLRVGDRVIGSKGLRTIKWIGWRHYHAVALQSAEQRVTSTPIRFLAGALADGLPCQDLRVSPWHHLYIDGVLVRANDLLNGVSIRQETDIESFSYYHLELDEFDVIRACGVYSESWADGGNRDFFQNVDVSLLRPQDKQRRRADRPGFAVLRRSADIAVIQTRLAARAELLFTQKDSIAA